MVWNGMEPITFDEVLRKSFSVRFRNDLLIFEFIRFVMGCEVGLA